MTTQEEAVPEAATIHEGGHHPSEPVPLRRQATRLLKGSIGHFVPFSERFISDHAQLIEVLDDLRSRGCVIVFTTGVWDLFHIGHAAYIQKGRDAAAVLYPDAEHIIMVVGVDTDALTKERKGPQRPIVPEDERYQVLGHLRSVDIITSQQVLNQLYELVSPHVLIVSTSTKDLPPDLNVARGHCEHVVSLPPQAETSTSARIRRLMFDGGLSVIDRVLNVLEEARNELVGK
jgi:D-glycero-beta-D-manno-heptose 1-phosphate adenylyltransferase